MDSVIRDVPELVVYLVAPVWVVLPVVEPSAGHAVAIFEATADVIFVEAVVAPLMVVDHVAWDRHY